MKKTELLQEFDRQLQNLIDKGYPGMAMMSETEFQKSIIPLRVKLEELRTPDINLDSGTLPFVIVIRSNTFTSEEMMERVQKDDKKGVTILRPHTTKNFKIIDTIDVPPTAAYLLLDIDRGKKTINIPPHEAMSYITKVGRFPLTIDEGIAIVTQFPEFLIKNNCFSLLGSRTGSDKRVPAIWINAHMQPNLGWCWDGNPHTWLGSASCAQRTA